MEAARRLAVEKSLWAAALAALALLTVYYQTAWSMVAIWSRSDTFAHGFLVLPIAIWLVWTYRHRLHGLSPAPSLAPLWLLMPPGIAWLLAIMVGVSVVQQLAMVSMLIIVIWAVVGHQLALVLAFPLFFLFFAVPMGEGLIQPMMEFTADTTIWLIRASGVPVYREGLNFTLPSGAWSVVEACSGVRYIIASVTVGVLYAYLTYTSLSRRLVFVAISAIVPVFANTLRAYMIVMLGHWSDMEIATGADHLVYGWVFFGVVIFTLFWIGSFFREDDWEPETVAREAAALPEGEPAPTARLALAALLAVALAAVPVMLAATRFAPVPAVPLALELPSAAPGWQQLRSTYWQWRPVSAVGGLRSAAYQVDGHVLGVFVQYADGTITDMDVIGSTRLFVRWHSGNLVTGNRSTRAALPDGDTRVDEVNVSGWDGELLAWTWYVLDGQSTVIEYQAKLLQVFARLTGRDSRVYRLVLATTSDAGGEEAARGRLARYMDLHGAELYNALANAREAGR